MKHSIQDLTDIAYQYFPRGMDGSEPSYDRTPEVQCRKQARVPASARYDDWRDMLRRLEQRFPGEQFPGVGVNNASVFLQVPSASDFDRCFTGELQLPIRSAGENHHELKFLVSFVVPYYVIRSSCLMYTSRYYATMQLGHGSLEEKASFALSPDEEPFARAIAEEIEATFAGYGPLPPDVGLTVIPDVRAGHKWLGEATIFTCLFSDRW